ncbi:hypothetical protein D3C71_1484630 [compost metagenome]
MRTTNKVFDVTETKTVSRAASYEQIQRIVEDKWNKIITVETAYFDAENNLLSADNVVISGENYTLLMSANPTFAPAKPANEYREVDLWYIVDLIRSH